MATQPETPVVEFYDEIAGTPKEPLVGLTIGDLEEMFPAEENTRRELIEGELIVAPPPLLLHQIVVTKGPPKVNTRDIVWRGGGHP